MIDFRPEIKLEHPMVVLQEGGRITVAFDGTDGKINIAFGADGIRVSADTPDTMARVGVIYFDAF